MASDVASETRAPVRFTWEDDVSGLIVQHGSLTAIAERLAEHRGYEDDISDACNVYWLALAADTGRGEILWRALPP